MGNRDMECRDSRGIILSRDRMDNKEAIMIIDGAEAVVSWRRCWLVWRAVVVWMLVCFFKGWAMRIR
jgi:hypothetical protein